eukprot:10090881-Karenia_brevis.AAC.1
MMRFSWHARSVEHNISQLECQDLRRATRKAFRFLCEYPESAYSDYLAAHRTFLDKHGIDASDRVRKRWARYIESEAIECALWPCIFFNVNVCPTVERSFNPDRKDYSQPTVEQMWTGWDVPNEDDDIPDQFPGPAVSEGRHSIKRLFCALALARD